MRLFLVWAGVASSLLGCSSPDKASDASSTAGAGATAGGTTASAGTASGGAAASAGTGSALGGGGGTSGTGSMAPACNQLELDAPDYVMSFADGSPPAAKGGTIADGTYFFKRLETYGLAGPALVGGRGKVLVQGSKWEAIEDSDGAAEQDINPSHSWSATFDTSGNTFKLKQTCPSVDAVAGSFTAVDDTLTLYISEGGVMFAEELERQ